MAFSYYKYIFCGLILFGYVSISKGATTVTRDEDNSTESYDDYGEDESDTTLKNDTTKPTAKSPIEFKYYKQYYEIGAEVHLKCPVKEFGSETVILWYKKDKLLSTVSKDVQQLVEDYKECCKIGKQTFILLNATENDSGNYSCLITSERLYHNTELILNESSAGTIHSKFELMLITFGVLVFLRIFNQ